MALYMDIHRNVRDIKKEQLDEAHKKDLSVQGKYGVEITPTIGIAKKKKLFSVLPKPLARRLSELSTVRLMVWRPTRF